MKKKNQQNKPALTLTLSLLVMLFAQLATAQNITGMKDKKPEERALFQTSLMKNKLSLDSVQLTKVQAINLKYALKNDPIIKGNGSKFSKFKQIKALQKEKDGELKKIFTAEQYKQYQAFEAEIKEKMKAKMGQQ
ncbi:hypothetical protein IDJ75_15520 [Mucilaginibacter rigui]|uniref:DUF4890 domain-containing protein n=1 Tax=Mucilaginibacter rigui TaxID=534635 RepID=A0ABR7X7Z0_9SPHI|nr:hypothetical protein [Mucilaginibacter rigui]MBD1386692.1 hypothetical protein [Mucilaginibacter rigui]